MYILVSQYLPVVIVLLYLYREGRGNSLPWEFSSTTGPIGHILDMGIRFFNSGQ